MNKLKLSGITAMGTPLKLSEMYFAVNKEQQDVLAAIDEGIIPGGGVSLLQAAKVLAKMKGESHDEQVGIDLVAKVAEEPLRMLATNSGEDAGWVVRTVAAKNSSTYGFNAVTNEFGDMVKAGVIEPAKVAIASLQNAASVASMILTTECLVTDVPEPEKPMPQGGGMPGMM